MKEKLILWWRSQNNSIRKKIFRLMFFGSMTVFVFLGIFVTYGLITLDNALTDESDILSDTSAQYIENVTGEQITGRLVDLAQSRAYSIETELLGISYDTIYIANGLEEILKHSYHFSPVVLPDSRHTAVRSGEVYVHRGTSLFLNGESEDVDTSSANLNKKAVWPQCYYSRYGGTRPTVSTFRNEYKKGKLSWYDGTYNGKGSEQLPTSYTAPTEPKTTAPTTSAKSKSTVTKNTKFKVKVYGNKKKPLINKTVKSGTKIKLPNIKSYTKNGYTYSLKKWKAKIAGVKKPKYIKKNVKKLTISASVTVRAVYKKTKIKTATKSTTKSTTSSKTKSKTSSATSATTAPTQATTEATEETEARNDEE